MPSKISSKAAARRLFRGLRCSVLGRPHQTLHPNRESTVDRDRRASNEIGGRAGEERSDASHIGGGAPAGMRRPLLHTLVQPLHLLPGAQRYAADLAAVNQAAEKTGSASNDVLASADQLSKQAVNLRADVDKFLGNIRAA